MQLEHPLSMRWRDALKDPCEYTRDNAVEALGDLGNKAKPAVPDLVELLTDESGSVRSHTVEGVRHNESSEFCCCSGSYKGVGR